jgi:hypothetical protein
LIFSSQKVLFGIKEAWVNLKSLLNFSRYNAGHTAVKIGSYNLFNNYN